VVVDSPENYDKWLAEIATHKPSPAPNQAVAEYTQETKGLIKTGWATVEPAQPPVVNYSN